MYCGFPAKKVLARNAIKGGAIIQWATIVTRRGVGVLCNLFYVAEADSHDSWVHHEEQENA
jgi:hypothetical protein